MVGIAAGQQFFSEAEQPFSVVNGNADDVRDHVHGQLVCDVLDEVAGAPFECLFDNRYGPLTRVGLESPHHAGRETGADQTALPNVVASVHRDEHRPPHGGLDCQLWAVVRAEQVSIAVRSLHVSVTRQDPEPWVMLAWKVGREWLPVDRRLPSQRREQVMWETPSEDPSVGEVDIVHYRSIARNTPPIRNSQKRIRRGPSAPRCRRQGHLALTDLSTPEGALRPRLGNVLGARSVDTLKLLIGVSVRGGASRSPRS